MSEDTRLGAPAHEGSAAATASGLRRHNQRLVLDVVRAQGTVRRSE